MNRNVVTQVVPPTNLPRRNRVCAILYSLFFILHLKKFFILHSSFFILYYIRLSTLSFMQSPCCPCVRSIAYPIVNM